MKKGETNKRYITAGSIGVAFCFLFLISLSMQLFSSVLYQQSFLSHTDIVDAFVSGDSRAIAEVTTKYDLWYQQIEKKAIVATNRDELPVYKIVSVSLPHRKDILIDTPQELLKHVQPYFGIGKRGAYIMIPLGDSHLQTGYLVYKPITL